MQSELNQSYERFWWLLKRGTLQYTTQAKRLSHLYVVNLSTQLQLVGITLINKLLIGL